MRSLRKFSAAFGSNVVHTLRTRGMIAQVTSPHLEKLVETKKIVLYAGIDPSAQSLHVGNLAVLMALLHFHFAGHTVLPLVGGATGRVGDPGGRSTERDLLDYSVVDSNANSITQQVRTFFSRASEQFIRREVKLPTEEVSTSTECNYPVKPPTILNNLSWLSSVSLLSFLRFPGKHLKVNTLMTRDSVKSRLSSEQGLSFAEFSYQLLQAYDFYVLNRDHDCILQVGGSDQWGNIISGVELIKQASPRNQDSPASDSSRENITYGLTIPLLTTSRGEKFGKSAGNAVWLDPKLTSVYDFYQFFIRVNDMEVLPYLRCLTLLPLEEIESIYNTHMQAPDKRIAQQRLASEVTEMIHGAAALEAAQAATAILFNSQKQSSEPSTESFSQEKDAVFNAEAVLDALGDHPHLRWVSPDEVIGMHAVKLASKFGIVPSNSRAKALINSGGLYLNNERITELHRQIQQSDFIEGKFMILRAGKEDHRIIALRRDRIILDAFPGLAC